MTTGTLIYIFRGNQVLLALKKRSYGAGLWNGPGGKIEFGENARMAAVRETKEEVGLTPILTEPIGEILYHDKARGDWKVTVWRTEEFYGQPIETEEMQPQWWPIDDIPFASMWPGDETWLPMVVANKKFSAELWFDSHGKIEQADLQELK